MTTSGPPAATTSSSTGGGNDLLDGGAGDDTMTGGTGDDIYLVDNAGDIVIENAGEGTDEIRTALADYSLSAGQFRESDRDLGRRPRFPRQCAATTSSPAAPATTSSASTTAATTRRSAAAATTLLLLGAADRGRRRRRRRRGRHARPAGQLCGALTLTANLTEIEDLSILGGGNTDFGDPGNNRYDYVITTHDRTSRPACSDVNGAALLAGRGLHLRRLGGDRRQLLVYGGHGVDTLTGGDGNDIFFFARTGSRPATGSTAATAMTACSARRLHDRVHAPGYAGLFTSIENRPDLGERQALRAERQNRVLRDRPRQRQRRAGRDPDRQRPAY